jgi:hypothetical protein
MSPQLIRHDFPPSAIYTGTTMIRQLLYYAAHQHTTRLVNVLLVTVNAGTILVSECYMEIIGVDDQLCIGCG